MIRLDRLAPAVRFALGRPPDKRYAQAVVVLLVAACAAHVGSASMFAASLASVALLGLLIRSRAAPTDAFLAWTGTQWQIQSADGTGDFVMRHRPRLLVMTAGLVIMRVDEPNAPLRWIWLWGSDQNPASDPLRKLRAAYFNRRQFSPKLRDDHAD